MMTFDEAKKHLTYKGYDCSKDCIEWEAGKGSVSYIHYAGGDIMLDGDFDITTIEAVFIYMQHYERE